jgi:putative transposase
MGVDDKSRPSTRYATTGEGASQMMQALGRRYAQYFNSQYRRSGRLWEGRYKSFLVQAEKYLIEVYR